MSYGRDKPRYGGGGGFFQFELAPNGKIYIVQQEDYCNLPDTSTLAFNKHLTVIHKPDETGEACGVAVYGYYLGRRTHLGLPNMPNYKLGPLIDSLPPIHAPQDTTICIGQSLLLDAHPQPGLVYRWAPDSAVQNPDSAQTLTSPMQTTTYTLSVAFAENPDCFLNFATFTVFLSPPSATLNANLDGPTLSASVNPFNPNFTYQWNFGDTNDTLTAQTQAVNHTYIDTGNYILSLTLTDTSGCKRTLTDTLNVQITDVSGLETGQKVNLYPNPTDETVTLEHNYENATIEIFTPLGKVVHSQNAPKPKTTIDLRRLVKGIYYVRLVTNLNQILSVKKLILY